MSLIGVGLIGHGASGALLHGPLLEAVRGYEIRAVATSRPESLALRRGRPRAVDVADCVKADDVDLVVVASPNLLHHRHARLALEAGKHVVVEKPFVTTMEEADDLIGLAGRVDRTLSVFQNRRFDADFRVVRRLIHAGRLGELTRFSARWDRKEKGVSDPAELYADLASHQIDQAIALFGTFSRPRLNLWSRPTDRGHAAGYDLEFEAGGVQCTMTGRTLSPAVGPSLHVEGTLASAIVPRWDPFDDLVRSGRHPAEKDFWRGVAGPEAILHENGEACVLAARPNAWGRFYDHLAGVVRRRHRPLVTPAQIRNVMALLQTTPSARPDAVQ